MKIYLQDLKNLLTSIQIHKVQELKVLDKNFELVVSNLPDLVINYNTEIKPTYSDSNKTKSTTQKNNFTKTNEITKSKNYVTITSPMVGTFYRAASPEEPPFVQVSDMIQINQTVCIIEAMKLMNEIEAEVSGKVVEILVKNGEFVDCGQALIVVEPLKIQ